MTASKRIARGLAWAFIALLLFGQAYGMYLNRTQPRAPANLGVQESAMERGLGAVFGDAGSQLVLLLFLLVLCVLGLRDLLGRVKPKPPFPSDVPPAAPRT